MKTKWVLALVFIGTIAHATPSLAFQGGGCHLPLEEQYNDSDVAVLGELIKIEGNTGTFKVLKTYKGKLKVSETMKFRVTPKTSDSRMAMTYDQVGDISYVFADMPPDAEGVYPVSSCWHVSYLPWCKRDMEECMKYPLPYSTQDK